MMMYSETRRKPKSIISMEKPMTAFANFGIDVSRSLDSSSGTPLHSSPSSKSRLIFSVVSCCDWMGETFFFMTVTTGVELRRLLKLSPPGCACSNFRRPLRFSLVPKPELFISLDVFRAGISHLFWSPLSRLSSFPVEFTESWLASREVVRNEILSISNI